VKRKFFCLLFCIVGTLTFIFLQQSCKNDGIRRNSQGIVKKFSEAEFQKYRDRGPLLVVVSRYVFHDLNNELILNDERLKELLETSRINVLLLEYSIGQEFSSAEARFFQEYSYQKEPYYMLFIPKKQPQKFEFTAFDGRAVRDAIIDYEDERGQ